MIDRRHLLAALAVALLVSPASARRVSHHKGGAGGGSWDGHWAGAWGGNDPTAINISGGRVVSYEYTGQTNPVSASRVTASRVSYGDGGVQVTMSRTGANTAHATIKTGQGNGTAEMRR